jgi:hypothetical protein
MVNMNKLEILKLLRDVFYGNIIDIKQGDDAYYPDMCIDYNGVMNEIEKLIENEIKKLDINTK